MILRCEHLSKSFDGVHALADLTLEFPASGIVAIIGPNGAGKTTLINVLDRLSSDGCRPVVSRRTGVDQTRAAQNCTLRLGAYISGFAANLSGVRAGKCTCGSAESEGGEVAASIVWQWCGGGGGSESRGSNAMAHICGPCGYGK